MTILIELEDGISINEHILDTEPTGYMAIGSCIIAHDSYGTVGMIYDNISKTFKEKPIIRYQVIDLLSQDELVSIDALKESDLIRYKLLTSMLDNASDVDAARKGFIYLITKNLMPRDRLNEVVRQSVFHTLSEEISEYIIPVVEPLEGIDVNS